MRVSSSPGGESNPVCRMPELVPLAQSAELRLGFEEDDVGAPPRRGESDARPHHPTADHANGHVCKSGRRESNPP